MSDIEQVLANAEKASTKDIEITRILSCHPKDYFAILEIDPTTTLDMMETTVKKAYRKKSLLIHPDKTDNTNAPQAFESLNKAQKVLGVSKDDAKEESEEAQFVTDRQKLIDIYKHVYTEKLPTQKKIQERVFSILESEDNDAEKITKTMKEKETQLLQQIETRKQELQIKKQLESQWEDLRDTRVKNWRDFTVKVEKKKKKTKKKVLA